MGNTCWRENTRIWSFDVCTNSRRYLCKSSWQSASPHYLSANRGHAEKKTVETETKGFVKTAEVGILSVQRFYTDWSSKSSCGLQPPNRPELVPRSPPCLHGATNDGHSGGRDTFGRKFMRRKKWKSPPTWPPLGVFHKAGWPLPRRKGDSGARRHKNN